MEIAILIFFLATFIGILFLVGLLWFVFRRAGKRQAPRAFSSGSQQAHDIDRSDDSDAFDAGYVFDDNQESANATAAQEESSDQSVMENPHAVGGAAVQTSAAETVYSNFDSGSSSDSSSSFDSGSSDSGSSSSSSD